MLSVTIYIIVNVIVCAFFGCAWVHFIVGGDGIFKQVPIFIYNKFFSNWIENGVHPLERIVMKMFECERCVAGQSALWTWAYIYFIRLGKQEVDLFIYTLVFSVCSAIIVAELISKILITNSK